jgi:Ca-activated chloride channel homolog
MRAQDFAPNRFEAAREVAVEFIHGRISDRVGLVVFAARAYTQVPLTLDYDFLQAMLAEISIGAVEDGTAIGMGLAVAVNRLKDSEAAEKVVILLTDGLNNRGVIDPLTAADIAAAMGVRVYTVGVGAYGEAPFVVDHPFSGRRTHMIPVEIDERMLTVVAEKTGGRYFRATSRDALQVIHQEIGELEKTKIEEYTYMDYRERYPRYLWPALFLLLLEVVLVNTRLRPFP